MTPLFQVMLALQNAPLPAPSFGGLHARPWAVDSGTAKFDLTLNASETPQGLSGAWLFNSDLLEGTTVERLAGHFAALLAGAIADPERPFADLPLLGAAVMHRKQAPAPPPIPPMPPPAPPAY